MIFLYCAGYVTHLSAAVSCLPTHSTDNRSECPPKDVVIYICASFYRAQLLCNSINLCSMWEILCTTI